MYVCNALRLAYMTWECKYMYYYACIGKICLVLYLLNECILLSVNISFSWEKLWELSINHMVAQSS